MAAVLFTLAELDAILTKYMKYWDDTKQIKDENILKNLDVTYLSSNHPNEEIRAVFIDLTYSIDKNDNINDTNLVNNLLDSASNWNTILYDKLIKLEEEKKIIFSNDNYIILDLTNELTFLYYNANNTTTVIKESEIDILKKIIELNNHNVFSIEFMLRRRYKQLQALNLQAMPTIYLEMINAHELFKIKSKHNLIDNILNKDNYYGLGRTKLKEPYNDNYTNLTSYKITYNFRYYINHIYNTKLDNLNAKYKFINYTISNTVLIDDKPIEINGIDKQIFMIGDIHGDFPRFVQILYNSGFIKFEGSVWSKIKMSDAESFKKYMHSSDIFKEVVWIPKNVLLISTGDLVDSLRNTNDSDATGDYELRVHLLILLLREQAIYKNSFIHFILGNHDRFLLQKFNIRPETSLKSVNEFFNSYTNRYDILSLFYSIYLSSYVYINLNDKNYIFTTHASLPIQIKTFADINCNNDIDIFMPSFNILEYMQLKKIKTISDLSNDDAKSDKDVNMYLEKMKLYSLLDEDRSTINYFNKKIYDTIDYTKSIMDNYAYIPRLNLNTLNFDKSNKINKINLINEFITIFNDDKNALSKDNLKKKFITIKDDENDIMHTEIDDSASDVKIREVYEILIKNIKIILDDYNDITDTNYVDNSISLQYINKLPKLPKLPTYSVFGHQIINETYSEYTKKQAGYVNHNTILSTCGGKINFIDIALSDAFGKPHNVFFELFHFNTINSKIGRLRTYTSPDRYILGAPLYPEIYYNLTKELIPKLEDGIPLVLEV